MFQFTIDQDAYKLFKYEIISEFKKEFVIQDEILNSSEAAAFLKITAPTLNKYVNNGQIPHFMVGDNKRFRRSDLLNLGKSNT
jgi:excisionase family DNA binding protein|tara:strand:- start:3025 stop:3273 length:249 start_codon:yes stop_codon:yes gene_type:complete